MTASGFWQISGRSATEGSTASASLIASAGASANGLQARVRAIVATVAGTVAGTDELAVLDGNTPIFTADVAIVATDGYTALHLSHLDLRASPGNTLTVSFVNGIVGANEDVNAQGDFVELNTPYGG